jgi:phage terminase large subunit-like protein
MLGGRGTGKTDALAHYINKHVLGPPCHRDLPGGHRVAIIAPTLGDAIESCVEGPSGLRKHNPRIHLSTSRGGTHVTWPSGAQAKLFGTSSPEDVERLRAGGNRCVCWLEELAAWVKLEEAWDHMSFGLRVGPRPHAVASTTPKPKKKLIELVNDPRTVVTRARTDDNKFLESRVREALYNRYEGSRLGRQELEGEILEDNPGALWSRDRLDELRVWDTPPLRRVVVAIDPSGGEGPENDEQGIAVCGVGDDGHGYMLADLTVKLHPEGWAATAVRAFYDNKADYIVAEINYGGAMVESTIRAVDPLVPVKVITASRGKFIRADPIATLDKRGQIHQVGSWVEMEDELVTWDPLEPKFSPNRLDARVWGFTELMINSRQVWFR